MEVFGREEDRFSGLSVNFYGYSKEEIPEVTTGCFGQVSQFSISNLPTD